MAGLMAKSPRAWTAASTSCKPSVPPAFLDSTVGTYDNFCCITQTRGL